MWSGCLHGCIEWESWAVAVFVCMQLFNGLCVGHCYAALTKLSHWCFSLLGTLSVLRRGWLRSCLDANESVCLSWPYLCQILVSSLMPLTLLVCILCRTWFLWAQLCHAFLMMSWSSQMLQVHQRAEKCKLEWIFQVFQICAAGFLKLF